MLVDNWFTVGTLEAISTSVGMRAIFFIRILPTMPACAAVPQAVMTILLIDFAFFRPNLVLKALAFVEVDPAGQGVCQ